MLSTSNAFSSLSKVFAIEFTFLFFLCSNLCIDRFIHCHDSCILWSLTMQLPDCYQQGRLSLSTVGDKCAKDNFLGGGFYEKFNKFHYTKILIIIAVKWVFSLSEYTEIDVGWGLPQIRGRRHREVWGYDVPPTFAVCTPGTTQFHCEWLPDLIVGLQESSPEEPKMHQNSWRPGLRPGPR